LRSCYSSRWHFFRDSPTTVTAGRFYYSPPGTPFVGEVNHFVSREWNDTNHDLGQGLGEDLTHPHKWYNGQPPAVPPHNHIVGRHRCLIEGEAIANALAEDRIRDGFNVLCFTAPQPIPLDPLWETASAYNQCSLQFFYATVLQWIYNGEAAKVATAFTLLLGPSAVTRFHAATTLFPAMVTVKTSSFSIAVTTGTTNFQQLALQGFYSLVGPTPVTAFSCNLFHYHCSTWIHTHLTNDGAIAGEPILLVGHSYGGVASHILAGRYRIADNNRLVRSITYGDPKPGDRRLHEILATVPGIALHNSDDFITVLPPDRATIFPVSVALGLAYLLLMDGWIPAPNGQLMDPAGQLHPNQLPFIGTAQLTGYVTRALANLPLAVIIQHAIPVYRERILLRCPNPEWPVSLPLWTLLQELDLGGYWGNDYWGSDYFGEDYFF